MRSQIAPHPTSSASAKAAMEAADVVPKIKPFAAAPTAPGSPSWAALPEPVHRWPQLPRQARVHPLQSMEKRSPPWWRWCHSPLPGGQRRRDGASPVIKPSPNRTHERHAGRRWGKVQRSLPMFDVDTLLGSTCPIPASQPRLRPLMGAGAELVAARGGLHPLCRAPVPTCAVWTPSSRPSPSSTSTAG